MHESPSFWPSNQILHPHRPQRHGASHGRWGRVYKLMEKLRASPKTTSKWQEKSVRLRSQFMHISPDIIPPAIIQPQQTAPTSLTLAHYLPQLSYPSSYLSAREQSVLFWITVSLFQCCICLICLLKNERWGVQQRGGTARAGVSNIPCLYVRSRLSLTCPYLSPSCTSQNTTSIYTHLLSSNITAYHSSTPIQHTWGSRHSNNLDAHAWWQHLWVVGRIDHAYEKLYINFQYCSDLFLSFFSRKLAALSIDSDKDSIPTINKRFYWFILFWIVCEVIHSNFCLFWKALKCLTTYRWGRLYLWGFRTTSKRILLWKQKAECNPDILKLSPCDTHSPVLPQKQLRWHHSWNIYQENYCGRMKSYHSGK